jgi:hypothetical protein
MSWCAPCQFDSLHEQEIKWIGLLHDFSIPLRERAEGVDGPAEYSNRVGYVSVAHQLNR